MICRAVLGCHRGLSAGPSMAQLLAIGTTRLVNSSLQPHIYKLSKILILLILFPHSKLASHHLSILLSFTPCITGPWPHSLPWLATVADLARLPLPLTYTIVHLALYSLPPLASAPKCDVGRPVSALPCVASLYRYHVSAAPTPNAGTCMAM